MLFDAGNDNEIDSICYSVNHPLKRARVLVLGSNCHSKVFNYCSFHDFHIQLTFFFFNLAKTDSAFKTFLDARNPTKQHSSTLESYLIKPVQRVLKYPLLLKELVSLTDNESEEHYHLTGNFFFSSSGMNELSFISCPF